MASITGQSGVGKIRLFTDCFGNELPVGNAEAPTTPGHSQGPFSVYGDLVRADAGLVLLSKANGFARLTGSATADTDGCALATEVSFSPILNGTLILEARVELQAITARNVFIGFTGVIADVVVEPLTCSGTTVTIAGSTYVSVGFLFDSQITRAATASTAFWLMPYFLSTTSTQTDTDIEASQLVVAGECDVLRVEVDNNGAARWYINGKLEQSIGAGLAATPATKLGALCGVWSTESTESDLDVDYLLVEANRDWTR